MGGGSDGSGDEGRDVRRGVRGLLREAHPRQPEAHGLRAPEERRREQHAQRPGPVRPGSTATTVIQPRPAVMLSENNVTSRREGWAPASPHSTPAANTTAQRYFAGSP